MHQKPKKIALAGLGEHAIRNILPALKECRGFELKGVYSRTRSKAEALFPMSSMTLYQSLDDVMNDPQVEGVLICLPNSFHFEWASAALRAGKHVWCEKPLCTLEEHWTQLIDEARRRDLTLFEGYMFRYHPQFERVLQLLASNELGSLRSFKINFGFPHRNPSDFRYRENMGGGALADAGGYLVAASLAIMKSQPDLVQAVLFDEPAFDVDLRGAAQLTYSKGEVGHLDWGFGKRYRNDLELWCENAHVIVERVFSKPQTFESRIVIRFQDNSERVETIPSSNHFVSMFGQFAHAMVRADERARLLDELENQKHLYFKIKTKASLVKVV